VSWGIYSLIIDHKTVISMTLINLIAWCLMPLSAIFQLSWRPVLVVEEAGVPGEINQPWASNW
jgi:hypothetical protein